MRFIVNFTVLEVGVMWKDVLGLQRKCCLQQVSTINDFNSNPLFLCKLNQQQQEGTYHQNVLHFFRKTLFSSCLIRWKKIERESRCLLVCLHVYVMLMDIYKAPPPHLLSLCTSVSTSSSALVQVPRHAHTLQLMLKTRSVLPQQNIGKI